MTELSHFEKMRSTNVSKSVEKKNGLDYLPWSEAWKETKAIYPDAVYEIKRFENNLPYVHDPKTGYMCFTSVTIEGITHEMWLPVMDFKNKANMNATMTDINKTIMRCLTKNLAMFGMGLALYTGEDLPEEEKEPVVNTKLANMAKGRFQEITESTALAEKYDEIKAHLTKVKANELTQKAIEELYNARSEELLNENA